MEVARQPAREEQQSPSPEFTNSQQLKDHYRAVRKRMQRAVQSPVVSLNAIKWPEPAPPPEPDWSLMALLVEEPPAAPSILTLENTDEARPPLRRGDVMRAVAVAAGLSVSEMRSHLRTAPLVAARFVYYVIARRYCGASLPQIGRAVGGRDHSTVLHGLRMGAERFRELYPIYKGACESLGVPIPNVHEFLGYKK